MGFVSEKIEPEGGSFDTAAMSRGEPSLPPAFAVVRRTWRSTRVDRGDTYLARHWFEFDTPDHRVAVVYFDRQARRGEARWTLYSLTGGAAAGERAI